MQSKKQQVVFIHGGEVFDSYDRYLGALRSWDFNPKKDVNKRWSRQLGKSLGESFEFILPTMPNTYNAKYIEWEIWFKKVLEFVHDDAIFIGHSLGGTFLIKYLSENRFDKNIKALFLISAAITGGQKEYQLDSFSISVDSITKLQELTEQIFIVHSKDDTVVPLSDFEILRQHLPKAEQIIFQDRDHFAGESFPELVAKIKDISQ